MKVTVVLCTYNRCGSLSTTLNSLAAQVLPESVQWEVLVVDNNSKDRTREVIEDFCRRHPGRFRYQFEPQQGKSHALNAGIREAQGQVLAFIDDDVTAEPAWLQNLTQPLGNGEWVGSGGRILPERTFSPPGWIPLKERYALAPLAMFDVGPDAGRLTEPPFGTNMAFRKEVFEKYGGFRTDLGPRPGNEIRNEDTEFGYRLLAGGEPLCYQPAAVVYHSVPESRLQKEWFLEWWFDKGRGDVRAFGTLPATHWQVAGIPVVLFRRLAVWTVRWLAGVGPSARFSARLKTWSLAGQILELHRQSRDAGR